jgi:hypothetical protein
MSLAPWVCGLYFDGIIELIGSITKSTIMPVVSRTVEAA